MKIMKKYISMIVAGLMLASCVETLILPDDKKVDEDFWKSKSDIQLRVNAAYQAMLNANVISRLIVWGGLRSEEMVPAANVPNNQATQEDLTEINLGNTQTDNVFAEWGTLYSVINICNQVLERAAEVMEEDPSYTEGDYLSDCSQMLALRSLCYFYLVRNFRDIPYITNAYTDSSQDRNVIQSDPESVLAGCIHDLEEAEKNAISSLTFMDWRRVGYFTKDAIDALLADIYLWRASVLHNSADYDQAVLYCDKVIDSKKSQHKSKRGEVEQRDYWLESGRLAFTSLYIEKYAEESIFELPFDGTSNGNVGVTQYFNHYRDASGAVPFLYASSIFKYGGEVYTSANVSTDWRGLMNTYNTPVTAGDFDVLEIRKYVSDNGAYSPSTTSAKPETKASSYSTSLPMNYIIYRLTDVMLMKAEALTGKVMLKETGDENNESLDNADIAQLQTAFNLVKYVNTRSKEYEADSLKWNTYRDGASTMEKLILAERLRELAFEGKRWYDLLRYNYRHVSGVDYKTTLADQNERGVAVVSVYDEMLNLMKRKLSGKGNAVAAKMNTESKLYMPIPLSDINLCPLLKQNPGYGSSEKYNKNY